MSVQRVYVHDSIADEVLARFTPQVKNLIVGDPQDKKTDVGPLISPKEVERVEQWVNEAALSGGKILCGGKRISDTLYEPTIILNPGKDAKVTRVLNGSDAPVTLSPTNTSGDRCCCKNLTKQSLPVRATSFLRLKK